jgi:hypothetical protein
MVCTTLHAPEITPPKWGEAPGTNPLIAQLTSAGAQLSPQRKPTGDGATGSGLDGNPPAGSGAL